MVGTRKKPLLTAFVRWAVLLVLLALTAACGPSAAEATPTPSPAPVIATPTAAATNNVATPAAQGETGAAAAEVSAQFVDASGAPSYSGEIVARSEVNVVAEVGGEVMAVEVAVGDHVQAGDVLVRIDDVRLQAQAAQALAGLEAAQAQLDLITTPPKEADLDAAKAAVAAAASAYRQATNGPTEDELRVAEAALRGAQAGVTAAQAAYNRVKGDLNIAARPENLQLQQAKLQVAAAQARYDQLVKGATPDVIAGAYAQLAQAQANLKNLENGASDEQVQAVEAQVKQAEAALYLAQTQVSKAVVHTPIDGVVSQIATAPGATAGSGALLVVLLSNDVEVTIPVEELRLPQLKIGQPATIQVAAYPDKQYPGKVASIAPQLDPGTRTARVTIRPTEPAPDLLPGMFATVQLPNQ